MKKRFLYLAVPALFASLTLSACNEDPTQQNNNNNPTVEKYSFTFEIDAPEEIKDDIKYTLSNGNGEYNKGTTIAVNISSYDSVNYSFDGYFRVVCSLMRCGLSMRSMASMVCTHVMPRLRMAALCPTCVFGKRPFFFNRILMARKAMLMPTIISVNKNVFNIFAYICIAKIKDKSVVARCIPHFNQN